MSREDTRAALDRSQRRTFAHESHRSAPLTTKAAEWDRRWLEGSSGLQVPKGMQHPTQFEQALANRRSPSPALAAYQYARESLSPMKSWVEGPGHSPAGQPQGSTQEQLAHTAYLFGDPSSVSAVEPGRLRLTLTGVNGDIGIPVVPVSPSKMRSGSFGGTVGEGFLNRSAISEHKTPTAQALIKKTDLTKSTHGHLGFERQGDPGSIEDRRRFTKTWTRKDHQFERDYDKVWAGRASPEPVTPWPYNERVRGGDSPDRQPGGLMKQVSPGDSTAKLASSSNQIYGAHVDQSPHDARRGRPTSPHSIAQHSTAFFGPVNWRSQKAENWEKRLTLSPIKQREARASGDRLDLGPAASGLGYGRFSISSPDLPRM